MNVLSGALLAKRLARLMPLLAFCLTACAGAQLLPTPVPPSPTGAPTSAPHATILPAPELLRRALAARAVGDDDTAADDLHSLETTYPQAAEARPARFYLAESFARRQRWSSAAETFRAFLADGTTDELSARAWFWLARSHEEAGAWAEAVAAYERFRTLATPIEPYARLRQAAQEQALGRLAEAAAGYEASAATSLPRGARAGAYEKAIVLRQQLGQPDVALKLYPQLLALAKEPAYRARILLEGAALAAQQADLRQARAWLHEIVEQAPETPQALDALAQVQDTIDPASAARALVAHERFTEALPWYDTAINAAAPETAGELRRLRALALRAAGRSAEALAVLAEIGAADPDGQTGRRAQLDWIQTRGQIGETSAAIEGYRQFADTYPDDPRSPEALHRVAVLLERLNDTEGAAQQRLELARRYPDTEQARTALERAAGYFFRAGRYNEAQTAGEQLSQTTSGSWAARGAFWAARAAARLGQEDTARQMLERTVSLAPDSYYAARAADLLGKTPDGDVPLGAPITAEQWRVAETWIATWSPPRPAIDVERSPLDEVARSDMVRRAVELREVGLYSEATAEWNEAIDTWREDAQRLFQLARAAETAGVPYSALRATAALLSHAPEGSTAPEALQRLLYPTPYHETVTARAREYNLDPRALYALLRQESLFNPTATSWAGALGIAQVMPGTGRGIAQSLQIADFRETDLYRPAVGIRFGAFYLGRQLEAMWGSLPAALAAYNGGPGNAQRWAGGTSVTDPDEFVEVIDFPETRDYVRLVYGAYGTYQRLCQPFP